MPSVVATDRTPGVSTWLAQFGIAALVMAVGDGAWLGLMVPRFYRDQLGGLMRPKPDVTAAAAFYLLYVVGVVVLVVRPGEALGWSAWTCAAAGALFGAVAYGTYDLTSRAVVRDFPWALALVDIVWGTVLTACVAGATAAIV